MAIDLNGSNQYLARTEAITVTLPFTMACWANFDGVQQPGIMAICLEATSNLKGHAILTYNDTVRAVTQNVTFGEAVTTGTFSPGSWFHACGVWSADNARAAYVNGGGKGTNSTNITAPATPNRTMIGAYYYNSSVVGFVNGKVAEAAIWSLALSDAEVALLASGVSPLFVKPEALLAYWPLIIYDAVQEMNVVSHQTLGAANSPASYPHPPILRTSSPFAIPPVTTVPYVRSYGPAAQAI